MTTARIIYLKKRDMKSFFISYKRMLAFLTVLTSLQPIVFWYLGHLQLNGILESYPNIKIQPPFWFEHGDVVSVILVILGLSVAAFIGLSQIPSNQFDKNMSKFDSSSDDELIKVSHVWGFTLWMFIFPMVLVGILGMSFLYVTVTANSHFGQQLQDAESSVDYFTSNHSDSASG